MGIRTGASWASLVGAVALACASSPDGAPGSLEVQMQRETDLPAATEVATADGTVRARVAGRLVGEFARTAEGSHYGMFDIGTRSPVGCHLFDEDKDPATLLALMSDRVFEEIGARSSLGQKAVYGVDAGNADRYPYLGVDWVATLDGGGLHLKQKFGNHGDRSLYCFHEDAGYAKTFETFFAGFLATLELPEEEAPTQYREISVMRIGGHEVGFEVSSVRRDEDGDYRADTQVALLVPSAVDAVQASDDYSIEYSRPDGSVINEVSISSSGADLTRLNLQREDGVWAVRGEMQGKSISETFDAPEQLTSGIQEARHLQSLLRGEAEELRYWRWIGAARPEQPVEHVMRKTGDRSATVEAGPVRLELEMDEMGPKLGTMKIGRFEMQMERVYVDGSL